MLKYRHGTGGDANDRDTMQGWLVFIGHLCNPIDLHCVRKYPGIGAEPQNQKPTTAEGASLK